MGAPPREGTLIKEGVVREEKREEKVWKKRAKTHTGDCTRKLLLKTIDRGKGESYNSASFLYTVECRF